MIVILSHFHYPVSIHDSKSLHTLACQTASFADLLETFTIHTFLLKRISFLSPMGFSSLNLIWLYHHLLKHPGDYSPHCHHHHTHTQTLLKVLSMLTFSKGIISSMLLLPKLNLGFHHLSSGLSPQFPNYCPSFVSLLSPQTHITCQLHYPYYYYQIDLFLKP